LISALNKKAAGISYSMALARALPVAQFEVSQIRLCNRNTSCPLADQLADGAAQQDIGS
jgi:hypothetical protein